jgi:hypothetical protein
MAFQILFFLEEVSLSCPILSGLPTMTVWIKEGRTKAQ